MVMKISTDERFLPCLQHLAEKYKSSLKHTADRYILYLKDNVDHFQLFDSIVTQIVTTMKGFYLSSKLKIKNNTLVKVLINYDKKSDTIVAGSLFKLTPEILLDSIYDFCLSRLKCRWHEVVALVNDNYPQLTQKVIFNELLRFLIINMDCRIPEAHIMVINHQPKICDQQLQPLPHPDEDIINSLIEVAPRQIFIHTDTDITKELVEQIETLFPNCVCIEYNAVL